jgi:hypothetical protein
MSARRASLCASRPDEKAGKALETFGRKGGTVRRPCHNEGLLQGLVSVIGLPTVSVYQASLRIPGTASK